MQPLLSTGQTNDMSKGITIKARIGVAMAFLAVLLAATSALGLFGMSRTNDALHDMFSNSMPSAVAIDKMEIYAGRERLALDRAALQIGTPEAKSTIERAHMLHGLAEEGWKHYLDLPRDANEDRIAQGVGAKRDAYYQAIDAFAATITANDQAKLVEGANRLQVAYK